MLKINALYTGAHLCEYFILLNGFFLGARNNFRGAQTFKMYKRVKVNLLLNSSDEFNK